MGIGLLRNFHPLRFCESCRQMKREYLMRSETECLGCRIDDSESRKENESRGIESELERKGAARRRVAGPREKEKAQPRGQVRLSFNSDSRATGIRLSRGRAKETS